mmetsp:Transcript_96549/g.282208  ORF Transcript_96549/g.282208 Transcript_96549/m.282208 type:complete len:303 (-) Transcript_96549:159-1067(-)
MSTSTTPTLSVTAFRAAAAPAGAGRFSAEAAAAAPASTALLPRIGVQSCPEPPAVCRRLSSGCPSELSEPSLRQTGPPAFATFCIMSMASTSSSDSATTLSSNAASSSSLPSETTSASASAVPTASGCWRKAPASQASSEPLALARLLPPLPEREPARRPPPRLVRRRRRRPRCPPPARKPKSSSSSYSSSPTTRLLTSVKDIPASFQAWPRPPCVTEVRDVTGRLSCAFALGSARSQVRKPCSERPLTHFLHGLVSMADAGMRLRKVLSLNSDSMAWRLNSASSKSGSLLSRSWPQASPSP